VTGTTKGTKRIAHVVLAGVAITMDPVRAAVVAISHGGATRVNDAAMGAAGRGRPGGSMDRHRRNVTVDRVTVPVNRGHGIQANLAEGSDLAARDRRRTGIGAVRVLVRRGQAPSVKRDADPARGLVEDRVRTAAHRRPPVIGRVRRKAPARTDRSARPVSVSARDRFRPPGPDTSRPLRRSATCSHPTRS
jgi:hypothetical protein